VRGDLQKAYATVESMVAVRKEFGQADHTNHPSAMVVALCGGNMETRYDMTTLATWAEPEFVGVLGGGRAPKRTSVGATWAVTLRLAVDRRSNVVPEHHFDDFEEDAAEIIEAMHSSARLHTVMVKMQNEVPVVPTSGSDPVSIGTAAAIQNLPPAKQADAILRLLAVSVVERVSTSSDPLRDEALAIVISARKQLHEYLGDSLVEARKVLEPTADECARAYDMAKTSEIVQPVMATLARVYYQAAHAQFPGLDNAGPGAFALLAQTCYKFWHRLLLSTMGSLCAMGVPYRKHRVYANIASTWSQRHKRRYAEWSFVVERCRLGDQEAYQLALAETLAYESKAKLLAAAQGAALSGESADSCYTAALSAVWETYARVAAKHLGSASGKIQDMRRRLFRNHKMVEERRLVDASLKVVTAVIMLRTDLGYSMRLNDRPPDSETAIRWLSVECGDQGGREVDRKWAEQPSQSTAKWIDTYKNTSIFTVGADPQVGIISLSLLERSDTVAQASVFSLESASKLRLKNRTKVSYIRGTQSHVRGYYGSEVTQGRRHGNVFLPDPSVVSLKSAEAVSALTESTAHEDRHTTIETAVQVQEPEPEMVPADTDAVKDEEQEEEVKEPVVEAAQEAASVVPEVEQPPQQPKQRRRRRVLDEDKSKALFKSQKDWVD
jgi:hypothetical protein